MITSLSTSRLDPKRRYCLVKFMQLHSHNHHAKATIRGQLDGVRLYYALCWWLRLINTSRQPRVANAGRIRRPVWKHWSQTESDQCSRYVCQVMKSTWWTNSSRSWVEGSTRLIELTKEAQDYPASSPPLQLYSILSINVSCINVQVTYSFSLILTRFPRALRAIQIARNLQLKWYIHPPKVSIAYRCDFLFTKFIRPSKRILANSRFLDVSRSPMAELATYSSKSGGHR